MTENDATEIKALDSWHYHCSAPRLYSRYARTRRSIIRRQPVAVEFGFKIADQLTDLRIAPLKFSLDICSVETAVDQQLFDGLHRRFKHRSRHNAPHPEKMGRERDGKSNS
jgi:hypothetical protein